MRRIKNILLFLLFLVMLFSVGVNISLAAYTTPNIPPPPGEPVPATYVAGGYSPGIMYATYCPLEICTTGSKTGGNWQGTGTYAGFYLAPNGNYYPIGVPALPEVNNNDGTGGGPAETGGICTGIYANCSTWSECSTSCGPGTQTQYCYDTGCSAVQTNTQACQTNDPNIWGDPVTACTAKCGGGTWDKVNQCGTTQAFACNTSACPAWIGTWRSKKPSSNA